MSNFSERTLRIQERQFLLQVWKFSNGAILSITEGNREKLGSLELTVRNAGQISSSHMIHSKYSALVPGMLGEMIATLTSGIAITSLYLSRDINSETVKALVSEVKAVISDA